MTFRAALVILLGISSGVIAGAYIAKPTKDTRADLCNKWAKEIWEEEYANDPVASCETGGIILGSYDNPGYNSERWLNGECKEWH